MQSENRSPTLRDRLKRSTTPPPASDKRARSSSNVRERKAPTVPPRPVPRTIPPVPVPKNPFTKTPSATSVPPPPQRPKPPQRQARTEPTLVEVPRPPRMPTVKDAKPEVQLEADDLVEDGVIEDPPSLTGIWLEDGPLQAPATAPPHDLDLISVCKRELDKRPDDVRAARLHFEVALATRDEDEALARYQQVLALVPHHVPSIQRARDLLLARRRLDQALPLFDAELSLCDDPRSKAELFHAKGRALEDRDPKGALACYRRAVEIDSTHPRYLKAIEQSDAPIELTANLYESLADAASSDHLWRAALLVERARLLENKLDRSEQATELYRKALELDPQSPAALAALERLFSVQHRWRDLAALLETEASRSDDPEERACSLFTLARTQSERLGSARDAIAVLERLVQKKGGTHHLVLETLVDLCEDAGDHLGLVRALSASAGATEDRSERARLFCRIGELHEERLGDVESARRWYDAALRIDPSSQAPLEALDRLYARARAWESLIDLHKAIIEAVNASELRARGHQRIGEIFEIHLNHADNAIRHHASALAFDPSLTRSFEALIRLYSASHRHRELIELYERRVEAADDNTAVALLFKVATLYEFALGDVGQAIHAYRRIRQRQPKNLDAVYALQRTAESSGRHAELVAAIDDELALVKEPPRRAALMLRAGKVLVERVQDNEAALQRFRSVLEIDPQNAEALFELGTLYQAMGRHKDVRLTWERQLGVVKGPAKVALLYRLGELCEQRLADDAQAIAYYRQATELEPAHAEATRALKRKLRRKKEWQALAELIEKELGAIKEERSRVRALYQLGELHEAHLGNLEAAEAAYRRALEVSPDCAMAQHALLRVHLRALAWKKAAPALEATAERFAKSAKGVQALLAAAELWSDRLNDASKAVACCERVLARNDGAVTALLRLEQLYRRTGNKQKLATIYRAQARAIQQPEARVAALEELVRANETGAHSDLMQAYKQILSVDGSHVVALRRLAQFARHADSGASLADLDARLARIERHPQSAAAHFVRLARTLEPVNPAAAVSAYRTALERDPESVAAARGLSRAAEAMGDSEAVVAALRNEAHTSQDDEHASTTLIRAAGIRLKQLDDMAGAIADAERALVRWPASIDAARLLGDLLRESGDLNKLVTILSRAAGAVNDGERVTSLWRAVARIYADELANVPAGIAALERLLRIEAPTASTLCLLGKLHARNHAWQEAVAAFRKALELKPERDELLTAHLGLGRIYAGRLRNHDAAISSLEQVLALDPNQHEAMLLLLDVHSAAGNAAACREAVQRISRAATTPEETAWAMYQLGKLELREGYHEEAARALLRAVTVEGARGEAATLYKTLMVDRSSAEQFVKALEEHLDLVESGSVRAERIGESYVAAARLWQNTLDDPGRAVATLKRGITLYGTDRALQVELAEQLRAAGRPREAEHEYRTLVGHGIADPMAWRGMIATLCDDQRDVEASLAAQALVFLGAADERESKLARQHVPNLLSRPLSPQVVAMAGGAELRLDNRVSLLLQAMHGGIAKLCSDDSNSRINARHDPSYYPLCELTERLVQTLGAGEIALFVEPGAAERVRVTLGMPTALTLSQRIVELPHAELVFTMARSLFLMSQNVHALAMLPYAELRKLIFAALQSAAPGYGADQYDPIELAGLQGQLQRLLSRSGKKQLAAAATYFVSARPVNLDAWAASVERVATRIAALLCGDVAAAARVVASLDPELAGFSPHQKLERSEAIQDLFRFWISEQACEIRNLLRLRG